MDDLKVIEQPADEAGRYKTLKNGALYDLEAKRIVKGAVLTSADASHLRSQREAKRQAIARQAANEAVQRADYRSRFGEDAYIAAIIETAMMKATTPDDPKAIEASRFVLMQTGDYADGQSASPSGGQLADFRGLIRDLADLARQIQASQEDDR